MHRHFQGFKQKNTSIYRCKTSETWGWRKIWIPTGKLDTTRFLDLTIRNDSVGPFKGRRAIYTSSKTNMDTYNIDEDVTASSGNLLNCWVGLQLAAIPSFQNTFSTFLIWPRRAKSTRIYRKPRPIAVQIHVSEIQPTTYCWWKKSQTTTWDVWHPVNSGIFTISTG